MLCIHHFAQQVLGKCPCPSLAPPSSTAGSVCGHTGSALKRALHLVSFSAVAVLKFFITFEQAAPTFILH